MIRKAVPEDEQGLVTLYRDSTYRELPGIVRWALGVVPERVVVVEEKKEIIASAYTVVCGYSNLWASYLAFRNETPMRNLVDYLMDMRSGRGLRNLYVFCPKESMTLRICLISRGFVPECTRKLGNLEYIVENHNGTFNPNYRIPSPKEPLPVILRKGEDKDLESLAEILHKSLPEDFSTIRAATGCLQKWLGEMPEYIVVAEYEGGAVGVVLVSPEISPVLDENWAMLCFSAVDESFRRRGVGKALVKEVCEVLRSKGKTSMEVDTGAQNVAARIFYTKTGFYPFWFSREYMPHENGVFYRIDF